MNTPQFLPTRSTLLVLHQLVPHLLVLHLLVLVLRVLPVILYLTPAIGPLNSSSSFWAADPKGTMSYRTEGGFSVRPSVRPNERTSERTSVRTSPEGPAPPPTPAPRPSPGA